MCRYPNLKYLWIFFGMFLYKKKICVSVLAIFQRARFRMLYRGCVRFQLGPHQVMQDTLKFIHIASMSDACRVPCHKHRRNSFSLWTMVYCLWLINKYKWKIAYMLNSLTLEIITKWSFSTFLPLKISFVYIFYLISPWLANIDFTYKELYKYKLTVWLFIDGSFTNCTYLIVLVIFGYGMKIQQQ